jgi:pentapeptide MXKDX repeat protein
MTKHNSCFIGALAAVLSLGLALSSAAYAQDKTEAQGEQTEMKGKAKSAKHAAKSKSKSHAKDDAMGKDATPGAGK